MSSKGWSANDIPDLAGKTAVVTGANSGIGFETALALAGHQARVILACRNPTSGDDAASRIRDQHPEAEVRFEPLDLADLASVRRFAERFAADQDRLDILCNNAGVMLCPAGRTTDGFETQFGTNHLGHFALTGLLLPRLRAAAGARVVTVSSVYHRIGRIDFDDLDGAKRYSRSRAYAQSKLANLLFTFELQRRFERAEVDAIAAAAHPGWTATNLQRNATLFRTLNPLFAQPPWSGARPTLYAATAPGVAGGDYYGPGKRFESVGPPVRVRAVARAHDSEVAARLWQVSEALTGVRFDL